MVIRLLLISLLVVSCGKEVHLKANKLESTQQITEADIKRYQKAGTLNTTTNSVVHSGRNYKVSIYSSKLAQDFIKSQPMGAQIPILFTGGFSGTDVVIETIQRQ